MTQTQETGDTLPHCHLQHMKLAWVTSDSGVSPHSYYHWVMKQAWLTDDTGKSISTNAEGSSTNLWVNGTQFACCPFAVHQKRTCKINWLTENKKYFTKFKLSILPHHKTTLQLIMQFFFSLCMGKCRQKAKWVCELKQSRQTNNNTQTPCSTQAPFHWARWGVWTDCMRLAWVCN